MVAQDQPADLEVQLILSANPALLEGGTWEVTGQSWGDTLGLWGMADCVTDWPEMGWNGISWPRTSFALDIFFQVFIILVS